MMGCFSDGVAANLDADFPFPFLSYFNNNDIDRGDGGNGGDGSGRRESFSKLLLEYVGIQCKLIPEKIESNPDRILFPAQ